MHNVHSCTVHVPFNKKNNVHEHFGKKKSRGTSQTFLHVHVVLLMLKLILRSRHNVRLHPVIEKVQLFV